MVVKVYMDSKQDKKNSRGILANKQKKWRKNVTLAFLGKYIFWSAALLNIFGGDIARKE